MASGSVSSSIVCNVSCISPEKYEFRCVSSSSSGDHMNYLRRQVLVKEDGRGGSGSKHTRAREIYI